MIIVLMDRVVVCNFSVFVSMEYSSELSDQQQPDTITTTMVNGKWNNFYWIYNINTDIISSQAGGTCRNSQLPIKSDNALNGRD